MTIRKGLKIFWLTIVSIGVFLFAVALALQVPQVQTFIARKAVGAIEGRLDGDISFEKIHLQPFRTLLLKNVVIIDRNPVYDALDSTKTRVDTFFRAEYITAKFSFEGLVKHQGVHLRSAVIENGQFNLVIEDKPDAKEGEKDVTNNLSRIFRLKKPETPKRSEKEIFHIKDVELKNMAFTMKNFKAEKVPYKGGINWNNLDIRNIKLSAKELQFKASIMSGTAEYLSFTEKSGYRVETMSGSAKVGRGKTIVENLFIDDPWSEFHLPLYMMSYDNVLAFSDFISEVKIDALIDHSQLSFETLGYFAPALADNGLKAAISGKASGFVDNFDISDFRLTSSDGGFSGLINGNMAGIPEIENTRINASVKGLNFTSKGLGLFLNHWTKEGEIDLSKFAKGIIFMADARTIGKLNDLDIKADISSLIGRMNADVNIENIVNHDRPLKISGAASTEDLDIGKVIGKEILGPISLRTGIQATLSEPASLKIDSLYVDRLHLNGYDYTGLKAVGLLSDNMFNGTIIANDPSLNAWFQGGFALSAKTHNARYKFYANIEDADLNALNIDKRGRSKIRFSTNANFTKRGNGNLLGDVDIKDLRFTNRDSTTNIGNINLTSNSSGNTYKMRLRSQFADGTFSGTAPITQFAKDLASLTARQELPALFTSDASNWKGDSYSLDFYTYDTWKILAFLMPGAYINKGTSLKVKIDSDGQLNASLNSQRLAMHTNNLQNISIRLSNKDGELSGDMTSAMASLAGFSFNDSHLKFLADSNHFGLSCSYDNHSDAENRGELVINGGLDRENGDLTADIALLPSSLFFNDRQWNIMPSSAKIKGKDIRIDSLAAQSGDQRIYAYGSTSQTSKDTLTLGLYRFRLGALAPILGEDLSISGTATGDVRVISPMKEKGLLADIVCDSTFIAGEPLGMVRAGSFWNEEFQRFDISLKNEYHGKSNIDAFAKFTPKSKILDASVSLDSLNIKYAQPFLAEVFSEMQGYISGDILSEGPISMLEIQSRDTRLDKALLRVDYTNVPYYADGAFHLDDTGVYFDNISIRDRFNGTGNVNGSIRWSQLKDITFDTRIKVENIEAINLTEGMNESFYGNLFATGNVAITGPTHSLLLTADAVTARTGQLHIPMTGVATAGKSANLLKFVEPVRNIYIDPYEAMLAELYDKDHRKGDFKVKLKVEASPNVEAFVELDRSTGNVLSGQGNGIIELEVGEDIFNIYGDYTLTSGKYNFSALGLVSREFNIKDGSSISFSGDIMQSSLDIDAIYNTKTSLSTLLADESSVGSRRNVECGIKITERLSNPRLEFFIEVPDLNPMIKSRVESALSTEDKVQKQFLSLLLSNSFLPDEQSGIVNNSSMLYSNVTEAMAGQLSNILHKLDIPLDLGLKYQPTDQGTDIFDVAVSTQLFNNRVVVNGNIGNMQYEGGGVQNDVVGDLDIEIKLNRPGTIRLNLFSHSADQYSNFLDNSQRNGGGITLQTEFNSFKQLIKNIFSNKEKRQAAKTEEIQESLSGERTEFSISKE